MLTIIALVVIAGILYFVFKKAKDANLDAVVEKVEAQLSPVVEKVEAKVEAVLDVNKDGAVTVADAVEVAKKVRAAKKSTTKARTATKKSKKPNLKVAK